MDSFFVRRFSQAIENAKDAQKRRARQQRPVSPRRVSFEQLENRELLSVSNSMLGASVPYDGAAPLFGVNSAAFLESATLVTNASSGWTNNFVYDPSLPLFVDPEQGNFSLADNSQAIDRGSNTIAAEAGLTENSTDVDGGKRIVGASIDVGSSEYRVRLAPPTNLSQTASKPTTVTIKWSAVENAANYAVVVYNADKTALLAEYETTKLQYTIPNLLASHSYVVELYAQNIEFNQSQPAVLSVQTSAPAKLSKPQITTFTDAKSIDVSWKAIANAQKYYVQYKISTESKYETFGYVDDLSCRLDNLVPNTVYSIRVKAIADGVNYLNSDNSTVTATTLAQDALARPQDVALVQKTATSAVFSWSPVENAEYYSVSVDGSTFNTIQTSVKITGLAEKTSYTVYIHACADNYANSPDVLASFTTNEFRSFPAPELTATSTSRSISVSWNEIEGAPGYLVQYRSANSQSYKTYGTTTQTSVRLQDLLEGTSYTIRVKAIGDGEGYTDSAYGSIVHSTTNPAQTDPPANPVLINAMAATATIAWAPSENGTSYRVVVKSEDNTAIVDEKTTTQTQVTVDGLTQLTNYNVYIYANADGHEESTPASLAITTSTPIQLATPYLEATPGYSSIYLIWNKINHAENYSVQYKKATDSNYTTAATTSNVTFTIENLLPDTEYVVRVKANPESGDYSESDFRTITVKTENFSPPVDLVLTEATATKATFSWTSLGEVQAFRALLFTENRSALVAEISTTETTVQFTNLTASSNYIVDVYAQGAEYESEPSTLAFSTVAVKKLATPTVGSVPGPVSISLTWNANPNAKNYNVLYKTASAASYTTYAVTTNNSIVIEGLDPSSAYNVRVRANAKNADYSNSSYRTLNVSTLAFDPPTNVEAADITQTGLSLSWDATPGATSYSVVVYDQVSGKRLNSYETTGSSVNIAGLSANTTYAFDLYAYAGTYASESCRYEATTKALIKLTKPTVLSKESACDSLILSWKAVLHAKSYQIYYKKSSDSTYVYYGKTSSTSYELSDLDPETTYNVRIRAVGDSVTYATSDYRTTSATTSAAFDGVGAPRYIKQTTTTTTSVTLEWNSGANADNYRVDVYNADRTQLIESYEVENRKLKISGLSGLTTYSIDIAAYSEEYGLSTKIAFEAATGSIKKLVIPTVQKNVGSYAVELSWNKISNAKGYTVYYKKSSDSSFTTYATTTDTSVVISGLNPSFAYTFRVRSLGDGVDYANSDARTITATTNAPIEVLPKPENIISTAVTATTVSLEWDTVADAASYCVNVYNADRTKQIAALNTTKPSIKVTGLKAETYYVFDVYACNPNLESSPTATFETSTVAVQKLTKPTVAVVPSSKSFAVSWNSNAKANSYTVIYKQSSASSFKTLGTFTDTSCEITGLTPNKDYIIRVRANGSGDYSNSDYTSVNAKTTQVVTLASPENIVLASVTATKATLAWNAVVNATSYSATVYNADRTQAIATLTVTSPTVTFTGLTKETVYVFDVYACDPKFETSPAAAFTVSTIAIKKLSKPTVTVVPASASIAVSWNAVTNADSYTVSYKLSSESSYHIVGTFIDRYCNITGLTPDSNYVVRVHSNGSGDYSNSDNTVVNTKTTQIETLAIPTNIVLASVTATTATLTWDAVVNAASYCATIYNADRSQQIASLTVTSPTVKFTGLTKETAYAFDVYASAPNFESSPTAAFTASTVAVKKLAKPSVTVVPSSDSFAVSWKSVVNANSYTVTYKLSSASSYQTLGTFTVRNCEITGLQPNKTYVIRVRANGSGDYANSDNTNVNASTTSISAAVLEEDSDNKRDALTNALEESIDDVFALYEFDQF